MAKNGTVSSRNCESRDRHVGRKEVIGGRLCSGGKYVLLNVIFIRHETKYK